MRNNGVNAKSTQYSQYLVTWREPMRNNNLRAPVGVNMRTTESEYLEPRQAPCGGNFGGNNATSMRATVQ